MKLDAPCRFCGSSGLSYACAMRRLAAIGVLFAAVGVASPAISASSTTITLHPGQSKHVGRYTVVCTRAHLAKRIGRIVLHPGQAAKIGTVRVRCVAPTPAPAPTPA